MTLLFIDSFDHYDTAEIPDKGYSEFLGTNHSIAIAGGRRGGNCLTSDGGANDYLIKNFDDSDTIVAGFAYQWDAFPSNLLTHAIEFIASDGTVLGTFDTTNAGALQITSGGQTETTVTGFYTPTQYNHYQVKYTKGTGADGFFELKKDNVIVLTITTSTATKQCGAVRLLETPAISDATLDDLYILNGLGTNNNDYLGDVRVDAHYSSADGASSDFVPFIPGDNFEMTDETLVDGDTTFLEAGTVASTELHEVDTASLGTAIHGCQQVIYNRKTDAGTVTMDIISQKPAGSGKKVNENALVVSDNYEFGLAILEDDPDDSTFPWTDARINATEFGFEIDNIVV